MEATLCGMVTRGCSLWDYNERLLCFGMVMGTTLSGMVTRSCSVLDGHVRLLCVHGMVMIEEAEDIFR